MRLYFDVGNTYLKWVIGSSGGVVDSGFVDYRKDGLSELNLSSDLVVDSVWASCVASSVVRAMVDEWVGERFALPVVWAAVNKEDCGVFNDYKNMSQLGVDRWMAVLGAKSYLTGNGLVGCPVIVIDAGTAVTVDVLDERSRFKGGVILPGLIMMHDSLVGRTAGINSSLADEIQVLGENTQECVNSGVHYGFLGAVNRVVSEILSDLSWSASDVVLLLTGGDSALIVDSLSSTVDKFKVFEEVSMLVVDGLRCVANSGDLK